MFRPLRKASYLLGNDLSWHIAEALRLFGFDMEHFTHIPQSQNPPVGLEDPELIDWCRDNGRDWITHDYKARKRHEADIKAARVHVVWIRGSPQEGATWLFFKMIVRTVDEIERAIESSHGTIHFSVSRREGTSPKRVWAEYSYDRPKSPK